MENSKDKVELEDKELEAVNGGSAHCQYKKGLGCCLSPDQRTLNECKNCTFNGTFKLNV